MLRLPFASSVRAVSGVPSKACRGFSAAATAVDSEGAEKKPVRFKRMYRRPVVQDQRTRNNELEAKATAENLNWRIVGATILHRYPVITRECEEWEKNRNAMVEKIDEKKKEILFDKIVGTDAQLITDLNPSYDDIMGTLPFKPAERITEADKANDRRSPDRRLQDSLFLIVKRNRADNQWQFPQGKLGAEETIRAGAERVVDRAIGKTKRFFMSNAPLGHYLYEYPQALKEKRGEFGAKLFFARAQLLNGTVKLQTKLYTDYAWIARDEVDEYFDKDTATFLKYLLPM